MKKSLIALAALSAFATAAQAQSSVSVYGSIDAGFGDTQTTTSLVGARAKDVTASGLGGASVNGALTSSRLGFRGVEDLGGGMKAQFNLEYQLANGTGNTTTTNIRTSTVGLSDAKLGTINIGRQLTGMHGVLTATSAISGSNIAGDIQYSDDTSSTNTADPSLRQHRGTHGVEAVRASNSISYITPAFSGLTVRVDYAADKADSDSTTLNKDSKLDHLGLSATYNQGPLLVTAGTHTVKLKLAAASAQTAGQVASGAVQLADVAAVTTANDETKFTVDAIAARYTLGAVKLNAIYSKKKQSYEGVEGYNQDAMQFGVSYDIGKTTLAGQYGTGSTKYGQGNVATDNGAKLDNTALQLAAIYNMSKRTNVYVAYGMDERETKQDSVDGSFGTVGDKTKRTVYAVGLRHSF